MSEQIFVKSSYSEDGACIEACAPEGSEFFASQWSGGNGGNCAEANILPEKVLLRDSKVPETHTHISPGAFAVFVAFAGDIARRDYPDA